jgi:hypothetical protein
VSARSPRGAPDMPPRLRFGRQAPSIRLRLLAALALLMLSIGCGSANGRPNHWPAAASSAGYAADSQGACSAQFGSFAVGHWPGACWRPYGTRSPFNTPIPSNPRLASDATAIANYIRSRHWSFEGDKSGNLTADSGGSRPVYWSRSGDPLVKVVCRGGYSCRRGMRLHIPRGAQPQNQSDGHMTVVDQAYGREYDFWRASRPEHGVMRVAAGNYIPIGTGTGTGMGGVAEAAGFGLLGGLIRAPELAAGRIEHALAITAQCVQFHNVWPSPAHGHGDAVCGGTGAGPHFGSLIQLNMSDAEIIATRAPAWQRAIMGAMAHYGMYVVDTNGSDSREMSLLNEDDQSFTSFGFPGQLSAFVRSAGGSDRLVGVPIDVSKLRVIAPCVPRGTC